MSLFFLTGLPRNRTSWFSSLFNCHSESMCLHDGLMNTSPKALVHYLRESGYTHSGDSDSAILLHINEFITMVPDARWVLLHRDVVDALDSYHHHFKFDVNGGPKTYAELITTFNVAEKLFQQACKMLPKALHVNFSDLDNVNVVQKIWNHCLPGLEFPFEKWAILNQLTVNVNVQKMPAITRA